MDFEKMISDVVQKGFDIQGHKIDASKLIFEERVKMNCFYCGRYNSSWKCPPRIPDLDYTKMISEFDEAAFIWVTMNLIGEDYNQIRTDSSVQLHRSLLECEKWLYNHNNSTALSFIGGGCKLCKNGCAPNHCANPYQVRTPVEALGINVVESAKSCGIEIKFPPENKMMRIGLLLW